MRATTEKSVMENSSPPPYSPERPPPPYSKTVISVSDLQNSKEVEKDCEQNRKAPNPIRTPFSNGSISSSTIHPRPTSPPAVVICTSKGINPVSGESGSTSTILASYTVKKATTAEPHDEFCPKCQCRIRTKQKYKSGRLTWLLVFIILILFFPIAFVPFLIDSCKDVRHYCPKCNMLLSVKKRFFF